MNATGGHVLRGMGWREDDPRVVTEQLVSKHISNLPGALARVSAYVLNYSSLLDKIPDQGPTSSCVGQALATSCFLTAKLAGRPIPRPSAKLFYDFARLEDNPYAKLISDDGSRPMAAIRCGVEKGLVAESNWPIVITAGGTSNINQKPPLDVYQDALGARIGDFYRIAPGTGAASLVRHALARGYIPVFAMPVDDAFMRWSSANVYEGRTGLIRGWHMQAIVGFGDGFLIIAGSWGYAFADAGVVAISNTYFDSGECKDIIVPTIVPSQLAA